MSKIPDPEIMWNNLLKNTLISILDNDTNYDLREKLLYRALFYSTILKFDCGIRFDPNEPTWPVVYIELPTGQVSWHMPQHKYEWDNHTTPEKFRRVKEYAIMDKKN